MGIIGVQGSELKIGIRSAPQKGAANQELIDRLAEVLGIPKGSVYIISGVASRSKLLRIEGIRLEAAEKELLGGKAEV